MDRLRQSQEENELLTRRRDELESRVSTLETEYEELLGALLPPSSCALRCCLISSAEKTLYNEETNDVDMAESMADLKVRRFDLL